jgi:hypothetical protein
MQRATSLVRIAVMMAGLFAIVSCHKNSTPTQPNDHTVPGSGAHITGVVHETNGAVLTDVLLHVVYEFPADQQKRMEPMVPSVTNFYDTSQVLDTACDSNVPLSDGVVVKIFWDRNSNGPDPSDPQPPLCANPPDCDDATVGTVNITEFTVNSVASELAPGLFWADRNFATIGEILSPNRFFARIYCSDGRVLYESDAVNLAQGFSEVPLHFHCYPCVGAPEVPAWALDQPYPNPATDSVLIHYGLQENAEAMVTLVWPNQHVDTLASGSINSGGHSHSLRLSTEYPNGLYTVRMNSSAYQNAAVFLKNESDSTVLRATREVTSTDHDGAFGFYTQAGTVIQQRGTSGQPLGPLELNRVRVVATRVGYEIADTTFSVADLHEYSLSFRLRPISQ